MPAPHKSKIGWTDYSGGDANVVTGCTPVSDGCRNCYARRIYQRFGRNFSQVQCHEDKLERLARRTFPGPYKRPGSCRPLVFVVDMGDLFHELVRRDFIASVSDVIRAREDVDWLILTKRPERMHDFCRWYLQHRAPSLGQLWLGVSVEDQHTAEERVAVLLETPGAVVRWISVEPMLGPVDLTFPIDAMWDDGQEMLAIESLDWVVCGGESGPNRRPFDKRWALQLLDQSRAAGTPFFFKQGSHVHPGRDDELPGIGAVKEWPE